MAVSAPNDTPTYAPSQLGPVPPGTQIPPGTKPINMPSVQAIPGSYNPSPLPGAPPTGVYAPSQLDIIAHVETGNRNIPQAIHDINTEKGTPAQGNFQFITPTWQRQAPKAGVDINKYPTAMSAPPSVQAQVAAVTPIREWGPNTVAALKARYPGLDTSKPPTGPYNGAAVGGAPAMAAPAPAATGARPSFADAAQRGDVGAMLQALTAEDAKGKSPLGSLGDNLSQNAGGSARSSGAQASTPMAYPAPQADYAGPAGQLMAQVTQLQNKPLSWSAAPFGSGAGMVPGTTLNS